jgi:hypothetical protein
VRCINAAASDEAGFVHIPTLSPDHPQNFGNLSMDKYNKGEKTTVVTLDNLQLPMCNLIKIDVEGFEAKVLKGARTTIEKYHPILYVENNKVESSKEILEVLDSYKYQCFWHFLPYYHEENYFNYKKDIFNNNIEINLLCFPEKAKVDITGFLTVKGTNDNWKKAFQRFRKEIR